MPGEQRQELFAAAELEVGEIEAGRDGAPAEGERLGTKDFGPEPSAAPKDGLEGLPCFGIAAQPEPPIFPGFLEDMEEKRAAVIKMPDLVRFEQVEMGHLA